MSNTRFNDKSEITSITGAEFMPITDGINDYKVEIDELANYYTIPTIKANISTNTLDIQELQGLVSTNTLDIQSLEIAVSTNTLDIQVLENSLIPTTPFSVNSAKVNASGYADFIAKVDDTSVVHYAGGSNPNIVETDVLGRIHTITADETITGMTNNGTYEMLKEYDLATGVALDSAPVAILTTFTNPQMSSNTAPSGWVASASHVDGNSAYQIWYAFDKDFTTNDNCWYTGNLASTTTPSWIQLQAPSAYRINTVRIKNEVFSPANFKNAKIQGSNNGTDYTDLYTITNRPDIAGYDETYQIGSTLPYSYVRLYITEAYPTGTSIQEIEITYGNTIKEVQILDTATFYDGDYRTVTGVQPNRQYKKVGSDVVETTFIRRGQVTKTAGTMGTPSSYAFNQNGQKVDKDTILATGTNLAKSITNACMPDYTTTIQENMNVHMTSANAWVAPYNCQCVFASSDYGTGNDKAYNVYVSSDGGNSYSEFFTGRDGNWNTAKTLTLNVKQGDRVYYVFTSGSFTLYMRYTRLRGV